MEKIFKEQGVIDEEDNDDPELFDSKEILNVSIQEGQEGMCVCVTILLKNIKKFMYTCNLLI